MAADLQIFDDNGVAVLTASTLFGRVLDQFNTGTSDGSRYVPGLTSAGLQPWHFSIPSQGSSVWIQNIPRISVANDTVTWWFEQIYTVNGTLAPRFPCDVIVGTN